MRFFLFIAGASATLHDASATLHEISEISGISETSEISGNQGRRALGKLKTKDGKLKRKDDNEMFPENLFFPGSTCNVVESADDGSWSYNKCKSVDKETGKIISKVAYTYWYPPPENGRRRLGKREKKVEGPKKKEKKGKGLKKKEKKVKDLLIIHNCWCRATTRKTGILDRIKCDCYEQRNGKNTKYAKVKFTDYLTPPSICTVNEIEKWLKEPRRKGSKMHDQCGGPDQVQ